jgi:hypothetical protein
LPEAAINSRYTLLASLCCVLAYIAYSLPWVVAPGASLTLNAYDLAEWSSLHPATRMNAYLTPLALRALPLLLTLLIANLPARSHWLQGVKALLIVIMAIALLPPFEFFGSTWQDNNHQQQVALAGAMLLSGILVLWIGKWRQVLNNVLVFSLLVLSIFGVVTGLNMLRAYNVPVAGISGGAALFVVLTVILVAIQLNGATRTKLPRQQAL